MDKVEGLINRVGKRIFLEYYYDFKELAISSRSNGEVVQMIKEPPSP